MLHLLIASNASYDVVANVGSRDIRLSELAVDAEREPIVKDEELSLDSLT